MPDLKIKIDLSGKSREKISDIFLKWSINVGKIIIIGTELLALGAFSYRFYIDRKIIDLHDEISKEEILVKSQEKNEKQYRELQEKLASIKTITDETKTKISILQSILDGKKNTYFITKNLSINQDTIVIEGTAFSIFSINNFIEEVKKDPMVIAINLDEIESISEGVNFKLNIELKGDLSDT